MEQSRSRAPLNNPPYFDGSNYPHWKVQMKYFIKMQGEWVWNLVEYEGGAPLKLDMNRKSTSELKPKR